MKNYKFLLLDADNTLLDFDTDMVQAFKSTYEICFENQLSYSPNLMELYERCNTFWWKTFEQRKCTKSELFHGRFADFIQQSGLSGDADEVNTCYFQQLSLGGRLIPGAMDFVEKLAEKYLLFIVTNGNASSQKARLERSGLLNYVKSYFVSEDAGAAKPDLAYFKYVFSRIDGFKEEEALVIGDSLSSDILGAKSANLDSVWYNPYHCKNPLAVPLTFEAANYNEILEFLDGQL